MKRLIESLKNENIKSGFAKTDINALDKNQVVQRLPKEHYHEEISQQVDESLTDMLKTVSGRYTILHKGGCKVHFTAGKAISAGTDVSDSHKDTELLTDGDDKNGNHSDQMKTNDDMMMMMTTQVKIIQDSLKHLYL